MKNMLLLANLFCCLALNAQLPVTFVEADQPAAPDYSNESNWNALPFRKDAADAIPKGEAWISDSLKEADVFYIYPTIYTKGKTWCADVNNKKLNKRIDKLPVKFQAAVFNHVARVYSPRYRQGIYNCFVDTAEGNKALDFAYADVARAFEYYMEHYNDGRPIIIVSHSQGTRHARQLLKDYFDTRITRDRLVCAYVIGFGIYPAQYEILSPCKSATDDNCYVTWSSFKKGYTPKPGSKLYGKSCINPISWKQDTATTSGNTAVLLNISRKKPFYTEAKITDNHLEVKTKTPVVRNWKVMHLVDFNLFWHSIRKNAADRVHTYLHSKHSTLKQ
jgi:hypothetical protein